MRRPSSRSNGAIRSVLVLWADNTAANLGLRAIAEGNARLIRDALDDSDVVVDFQGFGRGDSEVSFGTRAILKDFGRANGPIKSKLRRYDLIFDSGAGDSLTDIYGLKRLSFIVYAHWMTRRLGLPLVLAPQTIGPFQTMLGRFVARKSLGQAVVVLARDSVSATYSETVLGRRVDAVGTDVCFLLPAVAAPGTRDVIINVSGLLWFSDTHVDSEHYREQVILLVRQLVGSGRRVSLLAHVVHSPSGNDDVDAVTDLVARLGPGVSVEILVPETLVEARALLASGRIVVGARMHACLNALSQAVPAIPWGYSRKFEPLLADLGWTDVIDLRTNQRAAEATFGLIMEPGHQARLEDSARRIPGVAQAAIDVSRQTLARALRGEY